MAPRPDKNEAAMPAAKREISPLKSPTFIMEIPSSIVAPAIIGVAIRNEYFAAVSLDTPLNSAVDIVMPDLETPGIRATA